MSTSKKTPLQRPSAATQYTAISLDGGGGGGGGGKPFANLEDQTWWRVTHSLSFFLGGSTFIMGTMCYFYPDWKEGGEYAGWLYTLGSCGFLYGEFARAWRNSSMARRTHPPPPPPPTVCHLCTTHHSRRARVLHVHRSALVTAQHFLIRNGVLLVW